MKWLTKDEVRCYLRSNGVASAKDIETVLDGFDFDRIIYMQVLEPTTELFQYVRAASSADLSPCSGKYFGLRGVTQDGVAIIGGLAGRRLHRFTVSATVTVLEGSAKEQGSNWDWEGGGAGGMTQIYVPPKLLGHLAAVSASERW